MKKKCTCFLIACFLINIAYAQDIGNGYSLISTAKADNGLRANIYIHEPSIQIGKLNSNFVYAWFLFVSQDGFSVKNRFLINCSNYYYSNLNEIYSDPNGNIIHNNIYPIEFHPPVIGSSVENMTKGACAAKEQLQ